MPPLLPWAAGMMVGIFLDSRWPIGPAPCLAAVCAMGLLSLSRRVRVRAAFALAFLVAAGAGMILHHRAYRLVPPDHLATYTGRDDLVARVTGRVINRPRTFRRGYEPFEPWLFATDRTTFTIEAEAVEIAGGDKPACGKVRVTVKEAALTVQEGARVEVFGRLYRPRGARNPGQFDWALYAARRGLWVNLSCELAENVRILQRPADRPAWSLGRLRDRVRRALLDDRLETGDDVVSLLDAMVLGRRSGIDRRLEQSFVNTGCAHYLAVSGIHVGLLAMAVWFVSRLCGLTRRRAAIVVAATAIAYAVLADPRPPIIRAAIMICTFCLALVFRRRPSPTNALFLAAMLILTVSPASLFDAGFQLSFMAVAGILHLVPAIAELGRLAVRRLRAWSRRGVISEELESLSSDAVPVPGTGRRIGRWAWTLVCVTLTAWLCSLPTVASHFGRVAPWGWLDSLIAFPFVFVVMVLGFARLVGGLAFPILASLVDVPLDASAEGLIALMGLLERIPGTIVHVPGPPWWVCVAYFAVLVSLAAWRRGWLGGRKVGALCLVLVVMAGVWLGRDTSPSGLRVTVLSVGRGTSTVIQLPGGATWLYDAGASGAYDPGTGVIVPCLDQYGAGRLDGIVLSHPNLDHFGGVPSVVGAVDCDAAYVSPHFRRLSGPNSPGALLVKHLEDSRVPIKTLDSESPLLDWGQEVTVDILWPAPELPPGLEANDTSIVMRLTCAGHSMLLTGDIEYAAQQWLIENEDLSADVLLLPHHGSVIGNTAAFVEATGARYLVRSSFVRDTDSPELARLAQDRTLFNTAEVGAVIVDLDADGVTVRGFAE